MPVLGRRISVLRPKKDIFIIIKAFTIGAILASSFVHVLPDAFESLGSACLIGDAWKNFMFVGFIAMFREIGYLMVDVMASRYYQCAHLNQQQFTIDAVDMPTTRVGHNVELQHQSGDSEHQSHLHTHDETHACVSTSQDSTLALLGHCIIS